MKLKDLAPNPKNPRKIVDHKLQMLEHSVKEFGSLDGILYNRRTKRLFGGHQRQKLDQNAEIVIETESKEEAYGYVMIEGKRFPYREVDWDEKKELAANAAANKGAGEWDLPMLSDLLIELDDGQFDMDLTMFDDLEREKLVVPTEEVQSDSSSSEILNLDQQFLVTIKCTDEKDMQHIYEEMTARGYECKLIT